MYAVIFVSSDLYVYLCAYISPTSYVALPAPISLTLTRHPYLSSRVLFKAILSISREQLYIGPSFCGTPTWMDISNLICIDMQIYEYTQLFKHTHTHIYKFCLIYIYINKLSLYLYM